MTRYIGIEAVGASKTTAVSTDESGSIEAAVRVRKALSLNMMRRDDLRTSLADVIQILAEELDVKLDDLSRAQVCVGMTGVTFPFDCAVDLPGEFDLIVAAVARLHCTGDAEIISASHSQSAAGVSIVCHRGATGYAWNGDRRVRVGGWGPALGDAGSGNDIGKEALAAVCRERDAGSGRADKLWLAIRGRLEGQGAPEVDETWISAVRRWWSMIEDFRKGGFEEKTALFSFFHRMMHEGRWLLPSFLVPAVMRAWEEEDDCAEEVLKTAADRLSDQARGAAEQAGLEGQEAPLILYGGVLRHHPKFAELVVDFTQRKLAELDISAHVVDPCRQELDVVMRPVMGAVMFALSGAVGRLPDREVIERLKAQTTNLPVDHPLLYD